ncbi:MAG: glutathione S-transferase family protein [Nannocystis sp.]|nr:glutathione S-transferase family protein [Nannocystis sp.]
MHLVFRTAPMSSAGPVAVLLEELQIPHEKIVLDLARGDQKSPEHLALNPNGKVPTLVVEGTPLFEALAILQWIGDRFGVEKGLWPAPDAPARLEALSWTTWSYMTYGAVIQRLVQTGGRIPELTSEVHHTAAKTDAQLLLGILAGRLAKAPFLLGAELSLADLIVACVVGYGSHCDASYEGHAHVSAWMARCQARPSMQSANG